jgi:hypothetical protein
MAEQRAKRADNATASRVDYLLGLLSAHSQDDPPPALRGQLELLSSRRLRNQGVLLRFEPVFAVALLIVVGVVAISVAHLRRPAPLQTKIDAPASPAIAPIDRGPDAQPASLSPEPTLPGTRHALRKLARYNPAQRMTVRLPYSDAAIDTGTDATIQVSMSQAELAALGFPMNTTLHDRRVVAELTLGDDGLPRAISVSLPLQVLKEKK